MSFNVGNLIGKLINSVSGISNQETGAASETAPPKDGYNDDVPIRAPKQEAPYNKGVMMFCGRDWVVTSLESFAQIPDRDLRAVRETETMAEMGLSACMGFQVDFPSEPAEAKAFALRFAGAIREGNDYQTAYKIAKGEISPATETVSGTGVEGIQADEAEDLTDRVEWPNDDWDMEPVDDNSGAKVAEVAETTAPAVESAYSEEEIGEFTALLDKMAVPEYPFLSAEFE